MDKAGLIIREKNEDDKRNIDVTLTPFGQETAKDAEEARQQLADKLMGALDEIEKEQLSKILSKILNAFES